MFKTLSVLTFFSLASAMSFLSSGESQRDPVRVGDDIVVFVFPSARESVDNKFSDEPSNHVDEIPGTIGSLNGEYVTIHWQMYSDDGSKLAQCKHIIANDNLVPVNSNTCKPTLSHYQGRNFSGMVFVRGTDSIDTTIWNRSNSR